MRGFLEIVERKIIQIGDNVFRNRMNDYKQRIQESGLSVDLLENRSETNLMVWQYL